MEPWQSARTPKLVRKFPPTLLTQRPLSPPLVLNMKKVLHGLDVFDLPTRLSRQASVQFPLIRLPPNCLTMRYFTPWVILVAPLA